jgi:UDP-N-acetylmuramate--alanine ligase
MLASIFKQSPFAFTAFLGGISTDLGSNFYHQNGEGSGFTITEADEYDRSFLQLSPSYAAITSTDADHLDIYDQKALVQQAFQEFAAKLLDLDQLFFAHGKAQLNQGQSYSVEDTSAKYVAQILEENSRGTRFDLLQDGQEYIKELYVNLPGRHNVENAIAASLLAIKAGVDVRAVRDGLAHFKGIKRRFEYVIDKADFVYIDDYAHHPEELRSILHSVRALYPGWTVKAVFQPHLYSRTRDFAEEFSEVLSQMDELILLPIYPAREEPIEGVSSAILLSGISPEKVQLMSKAEALESLGYRAQTVLLTLGAGDIDRMVEPLKERCNG